MPWSELPRQIVNTLPRSLPDLADELGVTDARVLWYLEQLRDAGLVVEESGVWSPSPDADLGPVAPVGEHTVLPVATVHDFTQAYADAAAGMFGPAFVQLAGEHAGRVPLERVEEFRERLIDLVTDYFGPDAIDPAASPKYGFHWILTPVDLHPLGD